MIMQETVSKMNQQAWRWPIDIKQYQRSKQLTEIERATIAQIVDRFEKHKTRHSRNLQNTLRRLLQPLEDVFVFTGAPPRAYQAVVVVFLQAMHTRQCSYWGWTQDDWVTIINGGDYIATPRGAYKIQGFRQHVLAAAYLLCGFQDFQLLRYQFSFYTFATKVFGLSVVEAALKQIEKTILQWGYGKQEATKDLLGAVGAVLVINRSPFLEDLTPKVLEIARDNYLHEHLRRYPRLISRVLVSMKVIDSPLSERYHLHAKEQVLTADSDIASEWLSWCHRWRTTSTLELSTRKGHYTALKKIGRWLRQEHPDITSPQQWTRELAAECVAMIHRLVAGQWAGSGRVPTAKRGQPLTPNTKEQHLIAIRTFFHDCIAWEWMPGRFEPGRSFATPKSIRVKLGPNPRIIADDHWAKLLWAGLNLTIEDISANSLKGDSPGKDKNDPWYPLEFVRALVIVWLFSGLRADEIQRLRVGCVRRQREDVLVHGTGEILSKDVVVMLDVPTNKTSRAYTKPVDPVIGEAIDAWQQIRPIQPSTIDSKTGEVVDYLFSYRGLRIGSTYINRCVIPMLCAKAGVPEFDIRGRITSHRARSTIASQLFNAKEPMSLFELQEWLGHRSAASTEYYAKISPTKLAKAYTDAGYFERNTRTIEVLIDQEAVKSGAAAAGEPWMYYDLGHGYCSYDFFDQCLHRMACARCDFYRPKSAMQMLLDEAKQHLLSMKRELSLTDEELATIDQDLVANDRLIAALADVPTPAGPTPRQIETWQQNMIPVTSVQQSGNMIRGTID